MNESTEESPKKKVLSITLKQEVKIENNSFKKFSWHPDDDPSLRNVETLVDLKEKILQEGMILRGRRHLDRWSLTIEHSLIKSIVITTESKHRIELDAHGYEHPKL